MFYVYFHFRKSDGQLFYIGKGKNDRAWSFKNRNRHWRNTVAKHDFEVAFFARDLTETKAFEIETLLIDTFGVANLANMTNGGDGVSGYVFTAEDREKMAKAQRGRKHPEHVKQKISAAHIGMIYNEETRQKLSASARGRTISEVNKEKLRNALQGNQYSRNMTKHVFYHPMFGQFIGDMRDFQLLTGEHPTKLVKGKKTHIKKWVYVGINRGPQASQRATGRGSDT